MNESYARKSRLALLMSGAALSAGCTEYGYIEEVNRDVFEQVRRNTVDVLLVVDNSCSMVDEQDKLAANFDNFIEAFEGIDVDWHMAAVTTDMADAEQSGHLLGGGDEVLLVDAEGRTLDRVAWTRDWAVSPGAALQLDAGVVTAIGNDARQAWCLATTPFGAGDFGTPGAANAACGGASAPPDSGDSGATDGVDGTDDGADDGTDGADGTDGGTPTDRAPRVDEVLFTELLINPNASDDVTGEWVELWNRSADDLSLDGCSVRDSGRNAYAFPDGTTLAAGARLVVGRSTDRALNGDAPVDLAAGADLTLANAELFLTSSTENAADQFGELVSVGAGGVGIEMGLAAARAALSEPLLSGDNAGFLRDDANLSLIFISDENDFSPAPVNEYLRFFMDLKGDEAYRYPGIVTISAVVGTDVPAYDGQPSCESEDGYASFGVRYVDLASRTGGVLESICDEDFAPIASELGLLASGLELEFVLSKPANEETLVVKLYDDQTEESFIRDLVRDEEWTYVATRNAIRFEPDQVPASETVVVVEYEVLASSATRDDETDDETADGAAR